MHTPYRDRSEFKQKADLLASALDLDNSAAQTLLARVSGYADPSEVVYGDKDKSLCSSREELVARLLATRPEIANDRAANIIDQLALRVRDGDIDHLPGSPTVVPNLGG